jgi:heme exporter protein B
MNTGVSDLAPTEADLMAGLLAIIRRDLLLAWKRPGDALNPLVFYAMVCTLFPLATGPSEQQLVLNGPGVLWVAALLATLLALNGLFLSDYEDGSLDQLILSPQPLPLLVFGKALAHWLVTGVPLVLMSPLLAMTFRLPTTVMGLLVLTLTLGTLSLSMLGSIGAALTVGLNRGTALLSLLILPLAMPVLIFGARTVSLAVAGDPSVAGVYFLAAYCMLTLALSPFATAAALKISNE